MRRASFCLLTGLAMQIFILQELSASADTARKKVLRIACEEQEILAPHVAILGQTQASLRILYRGLTRFAIKEVSETAPDSTEVVKQQEWNVG